MCRKNIYFSIAADIAGVIAFVMVCVLYYFYKDSSNNRVGDPHSILVAFLGIIVTFLVGWNIYTMIDVKELKRDNRSVSKELERGLNYVHNKMDDLTADSYAFLCQQGICALNDYRNQLIKYQSILFGLQSVKIYSKLPGDEEKADIVLSSLIEFLTVSKNIKLGKDEINSLVLQCGEIDNRDLFSNFKEMFDLLVESKES